MQEQTTSIQEQHTDFLQPFVEVIPEKDDKEISSGEKKEETTDFSSLPTLSSLYPPLHAKKKLKKAVKKESKRQRAVPEAMYTDFSHAVPSVIYSSLSDEQKEKMPVYRKQGINAIHIGFFGPLQRQLAHKSFQHVQSLTKLVQDHKNAVEEMQVCEEQIAAFYKKKKKIKNRIKETKKALENLPDDPISKDTRGLFINLNFYGTCIENPVRQKTPEEDELSNDSCCR